MRLNDRAQESAMSSKLVADGRGPDRRGSDAALARALGRARLAILWERLWPALAAPATAVGLFLAVSWLGVWLWLPPRGPALRLVRLLLPGRMDALRRLDRRSGLPHRPATTIADDIAGTTDPTSLVRWGAHIERALRAAKQLKAAP